MNSKEFYLKEKPSRLFFKAAIPGGISMLASSFYGVFDSIFVGKYLGTVAFAALGLGLPIVIINFALADLIGVGASVPISILLGRHEDEEANNYFTCATVMIFLTGILMGVLLYFTAPAFMSLMGAEGELLDFGVKYIRIYAIFSPVTTMLFAIDNFLRISGKLKTSLVLNVAMSVGVVLLELLFILALEWDIRGSALAGSISMFVVTAIGIIYFLTGKLQLKFTRPRFSRSLIAEIAKDGSPVFLANVSSRIFSIVMNIMLLELGGAEAVAIYAVLMTLGSIVEQILYGVLDSVQPAIGYNFGAGEGNRVRKISKYAFISGAAISILSAVVIFIIPRPLAIPFLEDLSLLGLAERALRLFCISYLFKWISHAVQSYMIAIERPRSAAIISISGVFLIPTTLIFVLLPLGLDGLWLNQTFTSLLVGILAIVILYSYNRRHIPKNNSNKKNS